MTLDISRGDINIGVNTNPLIGIFGGRKGIIKLKHDLDHEKNQSSNSHLLSRTGAMPFGYYKLKPTEPKIARKIFRQRNP